MSDCRPCVLYFLFVQAQVLSTESPLKVSRERTLLNEVLDVATIGLKAASSAGSEVVLTRELGEAPLLGDDDLLATGELELCATEGLEDNGPVAVLGTDGENDLTNVNASSGTHGLTVGTTHSGLKSISTGAGQHLVDTQDVERVKADTHVERILARVLGDVLVGANTTSFKGLGRDLLLLIAEQMDAERELVHVGLLATQVVDTNLGVYKKSKGGGG